MQLKGERTANFRLAHCSSLKSFWLWKRVQVRAIRDWQAPSKVEKKTQTRNKLSWQKTRERGDTEQTSVVKRSFPLGWLGTCLASFHGSACLTFAISFTLRPSFTFKNTATLKTVESCFCTIFRKLRVVIVVLLLANAVLNDIYYGTACSFRQEERVGLTHKQLLNWCSECQMY